VRQQEKWVDAANEPPANNSLFAHNMKSQLSIEVKKSTIPRAGFGLFPLKNFRKAKKLHLTLAKLSMTDKKLKCTVM